MDIKKDFHTVRGYQLLQQGSRVLTPAMEDYLEMIYRNKLAEGYIRINHLSGLLNVKPSSATKMVQKLARLGFLQYEKYGIIFLTEQGRNLGEFLLKRHNIIEKFLKNIGISENILTETELIEHNVSPGTLANIDMLNLFFSMHGNLLSEFEAFKAKYSNKVEIWGK